MSAKPLNVTLKLSNLHCVTETDQWGGSAEPYIWTVFFKIDGDLVTHNFHPTVVTTSGNQADLPNQDVDAGENNPIPAKLGLFNTTLKPLPLPGKEGASIIGCVAVVMEQDDTAAHAIAKGHAALNAFVAATLQKFVDKAVSTGQMPTDNDIKGAIANAQSKIGQAVADDLSFWEKLANQDDVIGVEVFRFTLDQIAQFPATGHAFSKTFNESGQWVLSGSVVGKAVG